MSYCDETRRPDEPLAWAVFGRRLRNEDGAMVDYLIYFDEESALRIAEPVEEDEEALEVVGLYPLKSLAPLAKDERVKQIAVEAVRLPKVIVGGPEVTLEPGEYVYRCPNGAVVGMLANDQAETVVGCRYIRVDDLFNNRGEGGGNE